LKKDLEKARAVYRLAFFETFSSKPEIRPNTQTASGLEVMETSKDREGERGESRVGGGGADSLGE
jgi:hypothetical protein